MIGKKVLVRSKAHLRLVAGLPCLVTGLEGDTQSHHLLRITDRSGRSVGVKGVGIKNGDNYTIPLHYKIHDALHRDGDEVGFLARFGITNQTQVAQSLYLCLHTWEPEEYLRLTFTKLWQRNSRNPEIKRILGK